MTGAPDPEREAGRREHAVPIGVPAASSNSGSQPAKIGSRTRSEVTTTTQTAAVSSARTGRRGLNAVRASLTDRDRLILRLVADHRYLTTRQIEAFCFHNHHTPLTGARVARRVLRRLAELRVLAHLDRRIGGIRAGSAALVWRVGPVGDRLLREQHPAAARRRQREPGLLFLEHSLAVAETHLDLIRSARGGRLELIDVQTEPDCWRPYSGLGGARLMLQPDLYVVTGAGEFEDHWFLEIDRGTEHPKRLLAKCGKYQQYRRNGREQAEHGSFPLVVWIMPDEASARRLRDAIVADRELDQRLFRVTTPDGCADLIARGAL